MRDGQRWKNEFVVTSSKGRILSNPLRQILTATTAWLCICALSPRVSGQDAKSVTTIASLPGSNIPMDYLLQPVANTSPRPSPKFTDQKQRPVVATRKSNRGKDTWEYFETEFGLQQRSTSPVKRQIESAKYTVDVSLFTVNRIVRQIQDESELKLDRGHLRRAEPRSGPLPRVHANPLTDALENARVKLDLQVYPDKPFVGVKVVVPFGN